MTRLMGIGAAVAVAAWMLPVRPGVVVGRSMEPTLHPWQLFLRTREAPDQDEIRRGDVVVLRVGGTSCVKRIFALGGDRFWTFGPKRLKDVFLIDGRAEIQRWRRRFPRMVYRPFRVPAGMVYVLGDHPTSLDSRKYGPVPVSRIEARVVFPAASKAQPTLTPRVWTEPPPAPR